MRRILSVLLENESGALSRVIGLFAQRGYNIESLTVAPTDDPTLSRMTIQTVGDAKVLEQIEKQLNKLIEVIKVKTFEANEYLARELMIVKVSAVANRRSEIMTIADITGAKVMDITLTTMTLELCDTYAHLCRFEEVIAPYGIIEMVRTGTIAIEKGSDTFNAGK